MAQRVRRIYFEDRVSHTVYADGRARTFLAAGLKTRAGHATTWRVDSFMKQQAINPESMTNPNTAAITVSPKSKEVVTARLMMMIFFILLSPVLKSNHLTGHREIARGMPVP